MGGGWVAKLRFERSTGCTLVGSELSPETVLRNWETIGAFNDSTHPTSTQVHFP